MVKHLQVLLRTYLKKHTADQARAKRINFLIYDEYLKKYVRPEELLIRTEKKLIEDQVSLSGANEMFDSLLKKFIHPNVHVLPLKHKHEFLILNKFYRTNQLNFNTSSTDYFWGKRKGLKDIKLRHYPALPTVHGKSKEAGSSIGTGWAGQLTKTPESDPRPENSSGSCSMGPDNVSKKRPQEKELTKLYFEKINEQEKEISTCTEVQGKVKKIQGENCQHSKVSKRAGSLLQLKSDSQPSSKLSKTYNKNVFKNICFKLFPNGKYENEMDKNDKTNMSYKSTNDSCKTHLENRVTEKVADCYNVTENLNVKRCSKSGTNSAENDCDLVKDTQETVQLEIVTNTSFLKIKDKSCPCSLMIVETKPTKTKPDSCDNISSKSTVESAVKEDECSESIFKTPCVDDTNVKSCRNPDSNSAKCIKTPHYSTNLNTIIESTCFVFGVRKSDLSEISDQMKKECKETAIQELKSSSIQNSCTTQAETRKDGCDKESVDINRTNNCKVDLKPQNFISASSKNVDVSTEEVTRSKECNICIIDNCDNKPNKLKVVSSTTNVWESKNEKNINEKQLEKCLLSLSEAQSVNSLKTNTKDLSSKKEDITSQLSNKCQCNKEENLKKESKTLSAFQCLYIEPKVTEKLKIMTQKTHLKQVNSTSDLRKLKCSRYMGFKIRRLSPEFNLLNEIKKKTVESKSDTKSKSAKNPCATATHQSEIKTKNPKEYKRNKQSFLTNSETKANKSEQCLSRSLKNRITYLRRIKSSSEKNLKLKEIASSNKIKEENLKENKASEQLSKQSKANTSSQLTEVTENKKVKEVKVEQNVDKITVEEGRCLSNISNTVEYNLERSNQDFKKPSDQHNQYKVAEKINNSMSGDCCKTTNNTNSLCRQEKNCVENVDKEGEINSRKCPDTDKSKDKRMCSLSNEKNIKSSVKHTPIPNDSSAGKHIKEKEIDKRSKTKSRDKLTKNNQPQKTKSSDLCQANLKKRTLKKVKRNRSTVICSFNKTSDKNELMSPKLKASHDNKEHISHKKQMYVKQSATSIKPSTDVLGSAKEKNISLKESASKPNSVEKSINSKDNIASCSSGIKSTRMCSLQTLQKRITEKAVKKSKTVEIKSFSEMRALSSGIMNKQSVSQTGANLLRLQSEIKGDEINTVQDISRENQVVQFEKFAPKKQDEYWYNVKDQDKFILLYNRFKSEYSAPEDKGKLKTLDRDTCAINSGVVKSNLPKAVVLKERKGETVSHAPAENSNIAASLTKQNKTKDNIQFSSRWKSLDRERNIETADSNKKFPGKKLIKTDRTFEKSTIKDKYSNQILGLKNSVIGGLSAEIPYFGKAHIVEENQKLCKNVITTSSLENKKKENYKHLRIHNQTAFGKTDMMQQDRYGKETTILSNNNIRDIKTNSIEKTTGKSENLHKENKVDIKKLIDRQKLEKLKIFNPTLSKHVALNYKHNEKKENEAVMNNGNQVQPIIKSTLQLSMLNLSKCSNKHLNVNIYNENNHYASGKSNSENEMQQSTKSVPFNTPEIPIKRYQKPNHKPFYNKKIKTIYEIDNINALQYKEAVFKGTKQSLIRNLTGKYIPEKNKPVFNNVSTVKQPYASNGIQNSSNTSTLNQSSLKNFKNDVAPKFVNITKTVENNENKLKNNKISTNNYTLSKTILKTQQKVDFVANHTKSLKITNINKNKNSDIKMKCFTENTSNLLLNCKNPCSTAVNINFLHVQKQELLRKNQNEPMMRRRAQINMAKSSSDENLKSFTISNVNSDNNETGIKSYSISYPNHSDHINETNTKNAMSLLKKRTSISTPFMQTPTAKLERE